MSVSTDIGTHTGMKTIPNRQEGIKGICYYLARCGKHGTQILLSAKDHRLKRLGVLFQGMISGVGFAPEVEYVAGTRNDAESTIRE